MVQLRQINILKMIIVEKMFLQDYKVIFVDAYGVFNFGKGISKSVIEVFAKWVAQGIKVVILSNTTSLANATEESYAKKGVIKGVHYTHLMTSGQFAYEAIQKHELPLSGNKFYVFGTANFKQPQIACPAIFNNSDYQVVENVADANFIYCGIPQINGQDSVNLADFEPEVKRLVATGLPLVCANPDMRANEGGKFVVRQGSISALFEELGGKVVYYGKPDAKIYDLAIQRFCPDVPKNEIIMIGDTVRTDVLGANLAGIKSCLVVEGGVTEYEMQQRGVSLEEYLASQKGKPDFVAQRIPEAELF